MLLSAVKAFLEKYIAYLRWGVLIGSWVAIAWSVHHLDNLALKAAQANKAQKVAESIPKVITATQTITKVIHDAKDKCADTALPPAIAHELR